MNLVADIQAVKEYFSKNIPPLFTLIKKILYFPNKAFFILQFTFPHY